MTTTMLYTTGASVEDPPHGLTNTANGCGKARHRPTALQIKPLDPSELSAKLGGLSVESYNQPSPSIHIENSARSPLSVMSMGAPSPRTIPETHLSPSTTTMVSSASFKKGSGKLNLPSPGKPPRRGSIFDAFRFKGSNYTDEAQSQQAGDAQKPAPYRHVPQVAAQQFARTTTVETLSQKTSPKGMRPAPGPRSTSNATISLQDYHRQYKRAQSICSGRPSSGYSQSKLAGTVEMNERAPQQKRQNARGSLSSYGNRPELPRRMSTGNMSGKNDPQPPSPFRRDSTGVGGFQGNIAPSIRRGSASSSGFSDTSSSFRDSGPATPFKQEFGGNVSPNRRGSETSAATSGSRRGSFVNVPNPQHTAEIHRVDWSQSDQSAKVQRDSKWGGLKHRKTSVSQQKATDEKDGPRVVETASQPSISPKSPKPGFLKRFIH
ncbi:hypothetical protein FPOAC2_00741 [Fusarium poae]|uniref:Uncharacterized protein n=1 Tax=Fusarium poae TaxID=36050 RepID=A0A1B8B1X7_FUSPO|nr:hypothetical protein FPOAC1_000679 [Fusarium poae]KAG8674707.1 hypothetical protein FPOAC1_000679 [Fusarium poae]OBS26717.1 hypothetical protein FPOA_00659 [Fusarium poae]